MNLKKILEKKEVIASVPCRVDLGGTLDISTFFLPLGHLEPSTFNIALDMRTTVTLSPWKDGYIKISSKGFQSAEFEAQTAPFNHPMGLMFAVAGFFNADGVHVQIESSSPPRSALGGSSAAAVAMIGAFRSAMESSIETHYNAVSIAGEPLQTDPENNQLKPSELILRAGNIVEPAHTALLAHYIESSVAGVPCGLQDQLAAAYGGVNCWYWHMGSNGISFTRENLIAADNTILPSPPLNPVGGIITGGRASAYDMNSNILVAYCGIPHVSSDINSRWIKSFLAGRDRDKWQEIIKITQAFSGSVKNRDFNLAASLMNQETSIRLGMTPDVLDKTGKELFECAQRQGCGARFTGAGGGGCLWAIGEKINIESLRDGWKDIVKKEADADVLDTGIDFEGILVN
ncbi:MAG: galactokinase [Desulfamplus sp.]|nr:galactokinase [Desulfamplus sp.]